MNGSTQSEVGHDLELLLRSERVHDAFTRWAGVGGGPDAVARYEYSSQQLVFACQIALILLATFVLFWALGQGSGNVKRPAAFAGGDAQRQPGLAGRFRRAPS